MFFLPADRGVRPLCRILLANGAKITVRIGLRRAWQVFFDSFYPLPALDLQYLTRSGSNLNCIQDCYKKREAIAVIAVRKGGEVTDPNSRLMPLPRVSSKDRKSPCFLPVRFIIEYLYENPTA
jgi:hypothetical protein